jgi:hypothetical protein
MEGKETSGRGMRLTNPEIILESTKMLSVEPPLELEDDQIVQQKKDTLAILKVALLSSEARTEDKLIIIKLLVKQWEDLKEFPEVKKAIEEIFLPFNEQISDSPTEELIMSLIESKAYNGEIPAKEKADWEIILLKVKSLYRTIKSNRRE